MKRFLFFCFMLVFTGIIQAGQTAKLPELLNPNSIVVHSDRFFVIDGPAIYIYSLTDFHLMKKFGSKGEGPGEFMIFPGMPSFNIICHPGKIQINSIGKVSFFSLDGRLLKEIKHSVAYGGGQFYPLEDKFAGMGVKNENNKFLFTIDIYNSHLKKEKEVAQYNIKAGFDGTVLDKSVSFQTFENKIFVTGSNNLLIDVYDDKGERINEISHDYDNIKFTQKHKEEILDWYKKNPVTKNLYHMFENRLKFPSSFPAIKRFFVTDGKVYVQTYLSKDKKTEFFVFNLKGKLLKTLFLPIEMNEILEQFYLFCIKNGKLYQLVEDDEEIWHIDVRDIE
jgi:hypothetical protein